MGQEEGLIQRLGKVTVGFIFRKSNAMAIPNIEDVNEVEIGRYYMVPTITRRKGCLDVGVHPKIVPIIGPLHEDAALVGFKDRHWHPDRRFVTASFFEIYGRNNHWGMVYTPCPSHKNPWGKPVVPEQEWPLWIESGHKRMKCKRLTDRFGLDSRYEIPPWLVKMEREYKEATLRGMICPHRGISCVGVKPEADGSVVCPGHGLAWNPKTGELVSRVGNDFRQKSLLWVRGGGWPVIKIRPALFKSDS